ncbi:hypothetical protein R1sor_025254 [Riccia sorocarpa]|uniref:Uncharacterized protein n=1 Tax=Riccia sorocarpa TaxID=122646 RepID=A0ABD3G9G3_9MARC
MALRKRRGSEVFRTERDRSPVMRSLRRGGGGGRGRGAESESESDSAGEVEAAHDPLGRPRRPLRRRIVEDIFSEDAEEEEEPEAQEGAKPRRQVRENPLPEEPYRVSWPWIPIIDRSRLHVVWSSSPRSIIARVWEYLEAIAIDDDLVRTVFDVTVCTRPISACIRFSKLQDWMPIRDEVGKRCLTRFCAIEGWEVMLHVIQMVFFARRPRTVSGQFLRYLQGRFPGCETPWDDTRLARYNISRLIAESIRRECAFIQTHFQGMQERALEKRRFAKTFIGISLTLILLHLEILTEAECEACAVVPDGGFPLPRGDDSSSED